MDMPSRELGADRRRARAGARTGAAAPEARRRHARQPPRPRSRHRLARPHRTGAAHRAQIPRAPRRHGGRRDGIGRRPPEGGRARRARQHGDAWRRDLSTLCAERADRPAGSCQDADRDARLACREPSGSPPRHGAAGREHRARHHELSRPADRRARGGAGADQPRHRAGRPHRHDAADRARTSSRRSSASSMRAPCRCRSTRRPAWRSSKSTCAARS